MTDRLSFRARFAVQPLVACFCRGLVPPPRFTAAHAHCGCARTTRFAVQRLAAGVRGACMAGGHDGGSLQCADTRDFVN